MAKPARVCLLVLPAWVLADSGLQGAWDDSVRAKRPVYKFCTMSPMDLGGEHGVCGAVESHMDRILQKHELDLISQPWAFSNLLK